MLLSWVSDLTAFRAHPATQPTIDEDGNEVKSPLLALIDKKRSNVQYGDNESLAFIADLSGLEIIEEVPEIVTIYPVTDVFGGEVQETDEDGNKLWDESEVTVEYTERVEVGSHEEPIMVLEKQPVDGWAQVEVEEPIFETQVTITEVVDEEGGVTQEKTYTKVDTGETQTVLRWVYEGETTLDDEGNNIYPPKYEYVEVDSGETRTVIDYADEPRTRTEVVRTPRMKVVSPNPEVKAIYDRVYPALPYDVINEDGTTSTVTPPEMFGYLDGHI